MQIFGQIWIIVFCLNLINKFMPIWKLTMQFGSFLWNFRHNSWHNSYLHRHKSGGGILLTFLVRQKFQRLHKLKHGGRCFTLQVCISECQCVYYTLYNCVQVRIHEYNLVCVNRQMRLIPHPGPHLLPARVTLTQSWWSNTQDNNNKDNDKKDNDSQDSDNGLHLLPVQGTLAR